LQGILAILIETDQYDVFGDSSAVIKFAPGHTPGHQMLLLRLKNTGLVIRRSDKPSGVSVIGMDPDNLLTKVQSNPLAHELSNDIRKGGVIEALKQDAPACYAVSSQLEGKTQVWPNCLAR
jgi:hypothetical protein